MVVLLIGVLLLGIAGWMLVKSPRRPTGAARLPKFPRAWPASAYSVSPVATSFPAGSSRPPELARE
jgi:hypothetical protein